MLCTTKSMFYSTNFKGKDKSLIGVFLHDIYSKELVMDTDTQTEIIWSDGPSWEFKNQFIQQLIEVLSFHYKKKFISQFSATSHGQGVTDGIGGDVKSTVRHQAMSMKKDRPTNHTWFWKLCRTCPKVSTKY